MCYIFINSKTWLEAKKIFESHYSFYFCILPGIIKSLEEKIPLTPVLLTKQTQVVTYSTPGVPMNQFPYIGCLCLLNHKERQIAPCHLFFPDKKRNNSLELKSARQQLIKVKKELNW